MYIYIYMGFPGGSDGKESACNAGDRGLIPRLGRSPGKGNVNPFGYSCLENPMDRGAWRAIVHGLAKSWTQLSDYESESHAVVSNSLQPHGLYSPWNSPGQNTGVGSLSLLQGMFLSQRSMWGLPHCRRILYQPSHKGSPRILEWVAYPFSSGSSRPRNRTRLSCIAGRFLTK